ncbi:MAG TPA: recombinase family protein [Clostridia bacterium]|nr:recombinase family protein [Clostridia bacterium]
MKAVIYARFSSSSQREESIEGQIKVCRKYAENNDIKVIGTYIDKKKTAIREIDKRIEFQKMIKDSKNKKFNIILCYSLDRFARTRYDNAIYKHRLKKRGVRVISATERITNDAAGTLTESILEGMAEYYSLELSQKIRRGLNTNSEKCLVNGSVPYGYKSVNKKFAIDNEKAEVVKKIFEMYLNDSKMVDICRYLNGLDYKTKHGNEFRISTINKILQNKRYCGYYIYKDFETEDGIPAIVTKEQFNEVVKKMAKNKKKPSASKAKGEQYLLTGKLFCGYCESGMRGTGGYGKLKKFYQYYSCINRVKKPRKCDKKNVRKNYIEDLIVKLCYEQLTDKNIDKIVKEVMKICEEDKDTSNYKILEKRLKKLKTQKQNLIESLKESSSNQNFRTMIFEEFEKIENKELVLEKEMLKEENLMNTLTPEHILFFLNDLRKGDIKDYRYRQLLVDVFINKIYLYDDKITIVFNVSHEKTEFDLDFLEKMESSYLKHSTNWK